MGTVYPIVFEPIMKPKVWGGGRLAHFGKPIEDRGPIGESWELADLKSTSVSGGGGDPEHSLIVNGDLEGKSIRDAIELWNAQLLGDSKLSKSDGFPLLVKYLDANQNLSIQVHPSIEYAQAHDDAHLKTESWVVLEANPDQDGNPPLIYKGFKDGVSRDDLARAIESGTVPVIMRSEIAIPGQCHTLPSGTVHALGAGVLVAEIQTPSDTTFRVYDWAKEYGRDGRELHIEQAVQCASFDTPEPAIQSNGFMSVAPSMSGGMPMNMGSSIQRVASTEFYTIDTISASCASIELGKEYESNRPMVMMLLKSMGASIASESDQFDEVHLDVGQTVLIPAALVKDSILRAGPGTEAILAQAM